jgi:hypothetical protein
VIAQQAARLEQLELRSTRETARKPAADNNADEGGKRAADPDPAIDQGADPTQVASRPRMRAGKTTLPPATAAGSRPGFCGVSTATDPTELPILSAVANGDCDAPTSTDPAASVQADPPLPIPIALAGSGEMACDGASTATATTPSPSPSTDPHGAAVGSASRAETKGPARHGEEEWAAVQAELQAARAEGLAAVRARADAAALLADAQARAEVHAARLADAEAAALAAFTHSTELERCGAVLALSMAQLETRLAEAVAETQRVEAQLAAARSLGDGLRTQLGCDAAGFALARDALAQQLAEAWREARALEQQMDERSGALDNMRGELAAQVDDGQIGMDRRRDDLILMESY